MRFPWGVPTVSDAAKVEIASANAGERLYRLALQLIDNDALNDGDPPGYTRVNGGAATFDYSSGYLNFTGGAAGDGLYRTNALPAGPYMIEAEIYIQNSVNSNGFLFGGNEAATIAATSDHAFLTTPNNSVTQAGIGKNGTVADYRVAVTSLATGWDKIRIYRDHWEPGYFVFVNVTNPTQCGAKLPRDHRISGAGAFYVMLGAGAAGRTVWIRNLKVYSNYATDGPYIQYIADAGAGKTWDGWSFSSMAAVGSWVTTNAKFKYSFDDGVEAYNASWLTLAELQALDALTTRMRYARLQIQMNSDGATQQYAGELNADDATQGAGDFPELASVIEDDTVQLVSGDYHEAPVGKVEKTYMFGPSSTYEGELEVKDLTFAEEALRNVDPTEALVIAPTAYKILGIDLVGTNPGGGGAAPTFAGITVAQDNHDGSVTVRWAAATGETDYAIHVKAGSDFIAGDIASGAYLASASDGGTLGQLVFNTASGQRLAVGTTYYFNVQALNAGTPDGNSVSIAATITHPHPAAIETAREVTVYKLLETRDDVGAIKTDWTPDRIIHGMIQERSSSAVMASGQFTLPVTHSIYTREFPGVKEGFRVSWLKETQTVFAVVKSVVDQAGKGVWWRIDVSVSRP